MTRRLRPILLAIAVLSALAGVAFLALPPAVGGVPAALLACWASLAAGGGEWSIDVTAIAPSRASRRANGLSHVAVEASWSTGQSKASSAGQPRRKWSR